MEQKLVNYLKRPVYYVNPISSFNQTVKCLHCNCIPEWKTDGFRRQKSLHTLAYGPVSYLVHCMKHDCGNLKERKFDPDDKMIMAQLPNMICETYYDYIEVKKYYIGLDVIQFMVSSGPKYGWANAAQEILNRWKHMYFISKA